MVKHALELLFKRMFCPLGGETSGAKGRRDELDDRQPVRQSVEGRGLHWDEGTEKSSQIPPPPFSAGTPDLAPRGLGGRGGGSLDLGYAPGSPPAGGKRGSQMVRFAIFAPKTTGVIR